MKRSKVNPIKKPQAKKPTLTALDKTLDSYFSKYTRLKDSLDGIHAKCISCGVVKHIKELDNGHFKKRTKKYLKFDERNTHAQCTYCNKFLGGNESSYAVALEEKYGFGILQDLEADSKKLFKPTVEWYKEKIEYYKKKVKELDKYNLWG
jgi:hypothetical protein